MKTYHKLFIDIATRLAEESNCVKYRVGAVLVKDNRVISMGYNGTTAGFVNCCDKWDKNMIDSENVVRQAHHKWSMNFEIHAEMNCLMYACKNGIKTKNTVMYITHTPCMNCLKHIIQAGIKTIYYDKDYKSPDVVDEDDLQELLDCKEIKLIKL